MSELVLPNDTNTLGNLMGGRLMHWMDIAAAISAMKHCNCPVVTASVDNVSFKSPIRLGNLLTMNDVFSAHSNGFEDVLIRAPEAVDAARDIVGPHGLQLGLITSFTDPLPCTKGYSGTRTRAGTSTGTASLNLDAGCTGTMVRGPGRAPVGQTRVVANDTVTVPSTLGQLMGAQ